MTALARSDVTAPSRTVLSRSKGPELIAEMRALGVALKVCQNIAGRYDDWPAPLGYDPDGHLIQH